MILSILWLTSSLIILSYNGLELLYIYDFLPLIKSLDYGPVD